MGAQYAQYPSERTGPLNNIQPPHGLSLPGGIYKVQLLQWLSGIGVLFT